jgi:hypothetical protein
MAATVEFDQTISSSVAPFLDPSPPRSAIDSRPSMLSSHELLENGIATFVDVSSIMVAYAIGMHQSSLLLGLAYGFMDAFIVVWMRRPFARIVRWLAGGVRPRPGRHTVASSLDA